MSETVASPPIVPSSGTASGRGGGRGRGRSGSRGCGNRHRSRATTTPRVRSNFKGNTEEMNGHVFQCFNKCKDKKHFSKTVEALGEYIAKKLKYPGDMVSLTKDFVKPEIPKPTELFLRPTGLLSLSRRRRCQLIARAPSTTPTLKAPKTQFPPISSISVLSSRSWSTMAAPLAKTQVYWMLLPLSRQHFRRRQPCR